MLISFGRLTKKSFLFLVVPIAMFLRILIEEYLSNDYYVFNFVSLGFLGRIMNLILFLVVKRSAKSNKINEKNNKNSELVIPIQNNPIQNNISSQYEVEQNGKTKMEKKKQSYKSECLIFVCLLDFISQIYSIIFY